MRLVLRAHFQFTPCDLEKGIGNNYNYGALKVSIT